MRTRTRYRWPGTIPILAGMEMLELNVVMTPLSQTQFVSMLGSRIDWLVTSEMRHSIPVKLPPLVPGAKAPVENAIPFTGNTAAPVYVTVGFCGAALASLVVITVLSRYDKREMP